MAYEIFVSRLGLTTCPACEAHIRIAPEVTATECPFCDAELHTAVRTARTSTSVARAVRAGKSGLLAASLLGLAAAGPLACDDEEEPTGDATMSQDATMSGDATSTATGGDATSTATDATSTTPGDVIVTEGDVPTAVPLYGEPADIAEDTNTTEDTAPAPAYGIPADLQDDI